ncbi:MAG: putative metal-dependent hydrolase [Paraglaciecola psychrophila]|jgi:predicted metal-dependent hydrolase
MNSELSSSESHRVGSGAGFFDCQIKRQRRKTLALHVLADGSVEVRAPKWVSRRVIVDFVEGRVDWVLQQRSERLLKQQSLPVYRAGEAHYFLGQSYQLNVSRGRAGVDLDGGVLQVSTADPDSAPQVQKSLERWYRQQAKTVYEERLFACFESFPDWFQDRYRMPVITVRKMRRRWGSCSSTGEVTLNMSLIKMPQACIDYVIVHELSHLHAFHHGAAFYQLLSEVMPSWKEREALIESLA